MRIGHGFDAHRLAAGRRFVLGGIEVPFGKGPLGHSDADVLAHAVAAPRFKGLRPGRGALLVTSFSPMHAPHCPPAQVRFPSEQETLSPARPISSPHATDTPSGEHVHPVAGVSQPPPPDGPPSPEPTVSGATGPEQELLATATPIRTAIADTTHASPRMPEVKELILR